MALVKWKKDDLFPTFEVAWDDFFSKDLLNRQEYSGARIQAVNVSETATNYYIEVAIPGYKKESLHIDVKDDVLTISSEKKEETEEFDGNKPSRKEINYSSFQRSFQLPDNVDKDTITASYNDGVLKLNLLKTEANKNTIAVR
ncbi:Hsp20/alpha crystallin family protein [Emticicia sp. 17c]|uniref:Hsp20/alpha crystallin family protein n=1 Tax=Emticicia sp. 17c TaxID=3127704 RepID=UPI00301E0388